MKIDYTAKHMPEYQIDALKDIWKVTQKIGVDEAKNMVSRINYLYQTGSMLIVPDILENMRNS